MTDDPVGGGNNMGDEPPAHGLGAHDIAIEQAELSRNGGPQRAILAVALIGLVIAVAIGVTTLSSNSAAGGATPEEAVTGALDALAEEDMLGAAEMLLPTERRTLTDPSFQMVTELQRLGVLDASFDPAAVAGIDLEFADVELDVEQVTEDLAIVRLLGGQTSAAFEPTEFPFGPLVLDRISATEIGDATRDVSDIEPTDDGIAVVRRDGRWYISAWYTVAETARRDAGLPLPNPADALVARGEATAEAAVEEMIRSLLAVDLQRVIELLPPDEAEALHAYSPLFLESLAEAEKFARDGLESNDVRIELTRLDLSSTGIDSGRLVAIDAIGVEVESPVVNGRFDVGDGQFHATIVSPDGFGRVELSYVDGCFRTVFTEPNQPEQVEEFCEDDAQDAIDEFVGFGELPDFDIFTSTPRLGILTVEFDGLWYVSPLGTMVSAQVETVAAIDAVKLEELIDWMIEVGEGTEF